MRLRYLSSKSLILYSVVLILAAMLAVASLSAGNPVRADTEPNLLVNGNFDVLPFRWRYPNHFVADGWERWWIHRTVLPEYDDVNKMGGVRQHIWVDGGHAQVYFKWGDSYTAGIYQVVDGLTPCRPYKLTMHARTHSVPGAHPGSRIGLDPQGEQLSPHGGAVDDQTPLNRSVWSREQTVLEQWEELSVIAEPLGERLTAILYASPRRSDADVDHYYDTFWDAGALRPIPYANDRLPGPLQATTGLISEVKAIAGTGAVTLSWKLDAPATTQVWYSFITPSPVITGTDHLTHTTFLPNIANFRWSFSHMLPIDDSAALNNSAAQLSRTASLRDFEPGQLVNYVILARRVVDGACVTEFSGPYVIVTHP
jgi:hypothetical protein